MLRTAMLQAAAGRDRKLNYLLSTEVDPNSRIAVAKNQISFNGLTRNESAYVYDDFGPGYFKGDFCHVVGPVNISAADDGGLVVFWALTNTAADMGTLRTASDDFLWMYFFRTDGFRYRFELREDNSGDYEVDKYPGTSDVLNTDFWFKLARDESIGTYGTLYCYIYSDAALTTLVDTLSLPLVEKKDWRYLLHSATYNDSDVASATATTGGIIINQ